MKRLAGVLLLTVLFLGGCGKNDHFLGVWENKTAVVPWIKIEQDGEYYRVSSQITGPIKAIRKEGILYISDCEFRQPVEYDPKTQELIYCNVRYRRK